jgi:hypothetical protein
MRSPPLERVFAQRQHTTAVCRGGGLNKYQRVQADGPAFGGPAASRAADQGRGVRPNLRIKSLVEQTQDDEIHTVLPDDALTPGSSDDPNGMDSAGR